MSLVNDQFNRDRLQRGQTERYRLDEGNIERERTEQGQMKGYQIEGGQFERAKPKVKPDQQGKTNDGGVCSKILFCSVILCCGP